MGIAQVSLAGYVAKWGIAQMCLCENKYQGGGLAPFWGSAKSLKSYHTIWVIAAIVSQYSAIWGHEIDRQGLFRSPQFGVGRRGSPRFDPISSPGLRESSDLFRLLCFLPICSDVFSEELRANR